MITGGGCGDRHRSERLPAAAVQWREGAVGVYSAAGVEGAVGVDSAVGVYSAAGVY
jgi:hypothetical protein